MYFYQKGNAPILRNLPTNARRGPRLLSSTLHNQDKALYHIRSSRPILARLCCASIFDGTLCTGLLECVS
jgi:hypothetical protein